MLEIVDFVGEVMTAHKQSGFTYKSLVLFRSDHGPWLNRTERPW